METNNQITIYSNKDLDVNQQDVSELKAVKQELTDDIELARHNVMQLIETGIIGATRLAEIADQSQNSQAYERLGNFLAQMSKINKDLVELTQTKVKTKQTTEQETPNIPGKQNITNNLFVGSTADLAKALESMKKNE